MFALFKIFMRTLTLYTTEMQVSSAKARLSKSMTAIKTLRGELHDAEVAKHQVGAVTTAKGVCYLYLHRCACMYLLG